MSYNFVLKIRLIIQFWHNFGVMMKSNFKIAKTMNLRL